MRAKELFRRRLCRQKYLLLVCLGFAEKRGLPTEGPRGQLGACLPRRNSEWLNPGPRALIAYTADNADLKFTYVLPMRKETHEGEEHCNTPEACCRSDQLHSMTCSQQAGQTGMAGYFAGYTSKQQPIGTKELGRMREAFERKTSVEPPGRALQEYAKMTKRVLKDLEQKGQREPMWRQRGWRWPRISVTRLQVSACAPSRT